MPNVHRARVGDTILMKDGERTPCRVFKTYFDRDGICYYAATNQHTLREVRLPEYYFWIGNELLTFASVRVQ